MTAGPGLSAGWSDPRASRCLDICRFAVYLALMGTAGFDATQLLKGALDLAVLAVIAGHDTYGYDIARRIWASGLGDVREASVYGALNRLFRAGLLTTRVEASPAGPQRKYYGLTDDGMAYLQDGRACWQTTSTAIDTLLNDTSITAEGRAS